MESKDKIKYPELGSDQRVKIVRDVKDVFSALGESSFDPKTGTMFIPVTNDEESTVQRLHQQLHAKWSPDKSPLTNIKSSLTAQYFEDIRLNNIGTTNLPQFSQEYIKKFRQRDQETLDMVKKKGFKPEDWEKFLPEERLQLALTALRRNIMNWDQVDWLEELMGKETYSFLSSAITSKLRTFEKYDSTIQSYAQMFEEIFFAKPKKKVEAKGKGEKKEGEPKDPEPQPMMQGGIMKHRESSGIHMQIKILRMTDKLRQNDAFKKINAACGLQPTRMDRWVSDQKVFTRKKLIPHKGGTVLVDHSGSMSLTPADIKKIVMAVPNATVAYYNTGNGSILHIAAKNGRWSPVLPTCGGGNGCDGQALVWLLRQEGPYVWVSDGGVDEMNLVCSVLETGRVTQIHDVPTFLETIKRNGGMDGLPTSRELNDKYFPD